MPKNRKGKARSRSRARKSPKKQAETSKVLATQESLDNLSNEKNEESVVQSGEKEILDEQELVRQEDEKDEVVEEIIDDEVLETETQVTVSVQNSEIVQSTISSSAEVRAAYNPDTQQASHEQDGESIAIENLESKYPESASVDENDNKILSTNSIESIAIESQSSLKPSEVEDPGTSVTSKETEHNANIVPDQMESTCLQTIVVDHIDKDVFKQKPKIEVMQVQETHPENQTHVEESIGLGKQSVKEKSCKVDEPNANSSKEKPNAHSETNHAFPRSSQRRTSDPAVGAHLSTSFSSKSVNSREGDYSSAPEKEPLLKKSQNDREDMLAKRRSRKFCCC